MTKRHNHTPVLLLAAAIAAMASCASHKEIVYPECDRVLALVSADSAYEDVVEIPFDPQGARVKVSLSYDEGKDQLRAVMRVDRPFIALASEQPVKRIFSDCRNLRPQKLGYEVMVPPVTKFHLLRRVYRTWAKPRSRHIVNPFIQTDTTFAVVDTMRVRPLVPDSVVTVLQLTPRTDKTTITLRNLFILQSHTPKSFPLPFPLSLIWKSKPHYDIVCDRDLNRQYEIHIQRDPCFGTESRQQSLSLLADEVRDSWHRLISSAPGLKVSSKEALQLFEQHKAFLQDKYRPVGRDVKCAAMLGLIDAYNAYVDSIGKVECQYVPPMEETEAGKAILAINLPPAVLQTAARQIDQAMAQYLVSKDPIEKHDLIVRIRDIKASTDEKIRQFGIHTPEQRNAKSLYDKSVSYAQTYSNL